MANVIDFKDNSFAAKLKIAKKKDVVVVGGGPAGCIAALSARRNGADTLLIERDSYLGGMMTGSLGGVAVASVRAGTKGNPFLVKGIGWEMLERLEKAQGAVWDPGIWRMVCDPALMIHLLDEMMEEANVEVLFNTFAFDAIVENNVIKGVAIANKSGGQAILADVVVDASGDADIAAAAGAPYVVGRPQDGRHHGGALDILIGGIDVDRFISYLKNQPVMTDQERNALEEERSRWLGAGRSANAVHTLDGKTTTFEYTPNYSWDEVDKARLEGGPLHIRIGTDVGGPRPSKTAKKDGKYLPLQAGLDKEWIDYIKKGEVPPLLGAAETVYPPPRYTFFGNTGAFRYGKWRQDQLYSGVYECWFDQTNQEEITEALMYMRKINGIYVRFLRERVPGFENAYIVAEAPMVETRESRRIVGEYALTEDDLLKGRRFSDVIAKGGEVGPNAHTVTGLWGDGVESKITELYDIPYRCLVPQKIDNLLVAGRIESATVFAFGATRRMGVCMTTGEAAGAAAALSAKMGVKPRNLDVKLLQKSLLKQGALLFSEEEKNRGKEILNYVPSV